MTNAILEARRLTKLFPIRVGVLERIRGNRPMVRAVDNVDLMLRRGEVLALVGQSGSGKSTLGRLFTLLEQPTSGDLLLDGESVTGLRGRGVRDFRRRVQIIFQNPYESLDPRYTVGKSVTEPLQLFGIGTRAERLERAEAILSDVGLEPPARYLSSYPHELSGGQRQRVAIARALIVEPDVIVADEAVSMLDASVRSGVMNLLLDLQQDRGLSYLFITHDLGAARYMSQRMAVMHDGKIVDEGVTDTLIRVSDHPYTRRLVSAASFADPKNFDDERKADGQGST